MGYLRAYANEHICILFIQQRGNYSRCNADELFLLVCCKDGKDDQKFGYYYFFFFYDIIH